MNRFYLIWLRVIVDLDFEHAFSLPRRYATPPPRPPDLLSSAVADVSARAQRLSETQCSSWLLTARKALALIEAHHHRLHVSILAD